MYEELNLLITGVGSAGFVALLTVVLRHYKDKRDVKFSQQEVSVQTILKEYKQLNDKADSKIDALECTINKLSVEFEKSKRDVVELNNKVILLEASNNDLPFAYWLKDTNCRMTYFNESFVDVFVAPFGKDAADYRNKTDLEFWGERDINTVKEITDKSVLRNGVPLFYIETHKTAQGNTEYHYSVKYPRKIGTKIVGVEGLLIGRFDEMGKTEHLFVNCSDLPFD